MSKRTIWKLAEIAMALGLMLGSLQVIATPAWAQSAPAITTTTVAETVYRADGTAASATLLITWPAFSTLTGNSVPAGSTTVTIGPGGAVSIPLVPNANSNPMGSYYTVVYQLSDGTVTREYWVVPVSSSPVQVSNIRSTVLPATVAMQTVSKAYVDTAIANAAATPEDTSLYVLKTGDTMTGALNLPGDPTAPTQAADMNYVSEQIAGVTAGLSQKVSLLPSGTQIVAQPASTQLAVNTLNSVQYASQFVSGTGNNGIANATASANCSSGCEVVAEPTYPNTEHYVPQTWPNQTHVVDERGGAKKDSFFNPQNPGLNGQNTGYSVDVASTQSAPSVLAATGSSLVASTNVNLTNEALAGGNNTYPEHIQGTVPYFKTSYSALDMTGTNNTVGQHILYNGDQNCYGVGDCLMGGLFMKASGGFRDDTDEGAHPFDLQFAEDTAVFEGTCSSGCTTGATQLQVAVTANPATQGEGRYLIDKNPANIISTGSLIGGSPAGGRQPLANFSGTSFALSTFLETAETIPTQSNNIAPGTVTVPIVTSGVPTGFATSTAALPATTGVACLSDVQATDGRALNFETAPYTVIDASHVQLTLNRPHGNGATIAVGGLCGYGLEQTIDTVSGIRQIFPVIGSPSSTSLLYAGGVTAIAGVQSLTSAFTNLDLVVSSIARSSGVVTATLAGNLPVDVNGLTMTVQGVADSSYNGSFAITSTGPNTITYPDAGANSTSSGGTVTLVTGGYALYPMAEVLTVYNAATHAVDGQMQLAANTVHWASGDAVEQPHYFQERVGPDTEFITQYTPRPSSFVTAGINYEGNNGPGLQGWVIANSTPVSNYFGNGGTHSAPSIGINVSGVWHHSMELQAGEDAAIEVHCNSHGCNDWNSYYDLFQMDTAAGVDRETYNPASSTLNFQLRGTSYQFTPTALTAGTINVTTINATTVHGAVTGSFSGSITPASLPVFVGSGSGHQPGGVPDPGATAGSTRFLREDGTWISPVGSSAGIFTTLDTLYDFTNQTGTTVSDKIGVNSGTLGGTTLPTWTGNGLAFGPGSNVALPAALNAEKTFYFSVYLNPISSGTQVYNQFPTLLSSSTGGSGFNLILESPGSVLAGITDFTYSPTLYPNALSTSSPYALSGFGVFTIVCGTGTGNVDHFYWNGTELNYTTQASNCGAQTSGNLVLGTSGAAPWASAFFPGTFYGFGASSQQHTQAQVQQNVSAFLALASSKGIPITPVALPQATPQLLAIGDSITAGTNGQTPYTSQLTLTNQPAYTISNYGIVGIRLASMLSHEANRGALRCSSQGGPVVALLEGGTNDLYLTNPLSPQQVWNSAGAWASLMRKAGCTPFMLTMISRTGTGYNSETMDALKDSYDALLVQQAKAAGFAGVLDVAANPLLGADGAYNNTTYFQSIDHIHPTTLGNSLMAAAVSNGLNWYFGYNDLNPHGLTTLAGFTMACSDGAIDLSGLTAGGNIVLPDCTGASGATFRINNPQTAYAVTVTADSSSHPVNGSSSAVTVPAGGSLVLHLVPNPKTTAGWHWEF
jgi:lysophospholipase L1-like esterase